MAVKTLPPRDLVRQLLHYNAETGALIWVTRPLDMFPDERAFHIWNTRYAGKPAGSLKEGRIEVSINGIRYKAHRLVWLYVKGEPVPNLIDHWDRNKANNRMDNLREATKAQNSTNSLAYKNNKVGAKGVRAKNGRFYAVIVFNGKRVWLGTFDTVEEASKAYRDAATRLYGEFARS